MEQSCPFTSPVRFVGGSHDVPDASLGSAANLTTKSSPAFYRTPTTKVRQQVFINGVPSDTAAVSLVSFDRGTAAVPVAQTELQATDTAAAHSTLFRCLPHPNPIFPLGPASSSTSRRRYSVAWPYSRGPLIAHPQTLPGALIYLGSAQYNSGVNLAHSMFTAYSVERALSVTFRA